MKEQVKTALKSYFFSLQKYPKQVNKLKTSKKQTGFAQIFQFQ